MAFLLLFLIFSRLLHRLHHWEKVFLYKLIQRIIFILTYMQYDHFCAQCKGKLKWTIRGEEKMTKKNVNVGTIILQWMVSNVLSGRKKILKSLVMKNIFYCKVREWAATKSFAYGGNRFSEHYFPSLLSSPKKRFPSKRFGNQVTKKR